MRPEEKLFDAVTGIDEELVESAQNYVFRKQTQPWQRVASLAACLLVMVSIGYGILLMGGIGGMGGSDSAANSSTTGDTAAPEENGSVGGNAGISGDVDDSADASDQEGTAETVTFTATVLEMGDGYLLVEPVEGDAMLATADRIQVPVGDVILPDGVTEGIVVRITFTGGVMESYPAQIANVVEITLAEE